MNFQNQPACLTTKALRALVFSVVALAFSLFTGTAFSQAVGEAKGFKTANHYPAPNESQIKTLLKSARIKPLPNACFQLLKMTIEEFSVTNSLEMVITAPECIYDSDRRHSTASSAGPLRVETADGKFSIEGIGFLWRQTNSSLTISNRVRTLVQPEVLAGSSAPTSPSASTSKNSPLEILSDHFEYSTNSALGVYRGHVRVNGTFNGTNMALTGGVLTLKLPMNMNKPQLEALTTEQDVVLDYSGVHATGQKAHYTVDTGLLNVYGQPAWSTEQREGHADELLIDRTNKIFCALGNGYLKLSGPSLAGANFLPTDDSSSTNKLTEGNRVVEIFSDNYEIRTNWAVFRKAVRVREQREGQQPSRMTCDVMTANFAGTNQLDKLTAETQVVMEQADKRFTAGKAVYTRTNGIMELTQNPAWASQKGQGQGDLIRMNLQRKEMIVRDHAKMQLPADQFGVSDLSGLKTLRPKTSPAPSNAKAEISCQEYEYTPEPGHVQFRGGVAVQHPQMDLTCKTMTANLPAPGEQTKSLTAEEAVKFNVQDNKGRLVHGTGDKAVYNYSATATATNDVLHLTGNPAVVQGTNGTWQNNLIVWDRTKDSFSTPGSYNIRMKTPFTNTLEFQGNLFNQDRKPKKAK